MCVCVCVCACVCVCRVTCFVFFGLALFALVFVLPLAGCVVLRCVFGFALPFGLFLWFLCVVCLCVFVCIRMQSTDSSFFRAKAPWVKSK